MDVATPGNARLIGRTAAWMASACALLALIQLLAAGLPVTDLAPACAVAALGLMVKRSGERPPAWAPPLICVSLLALGTYTVAATGRSDGTLPAFVLPVIWVGAFFRREHILLVVLGGALADGLALAALGGHGGHGAAWIEVVASLGAVAALTGTVVNGYSTALAAREAEARVDPLTGLLNRRGLLERAAAELVRARRSGQAMSLIAFDLDHFKQVNDCLGHDFGDRVLVRFAAVLRKHVRSIDVVARTGGEEFLVLLPSCGIEDARAVADRVREELSSAPVDDQVRVSFSAGVATDLRPCELRPMLLAADRALYAAKAGGRGLTVSAGQPDHPWHEEPAPTAAM